MHSRGIKYKHPLYRHITQTDTLHLLCTILVKSLGSFINFVFHIFYIFVLKNHKKHFSQVTLNFSPEVYTFLIKCVHFNKGIVDIKKTLMSSQTCMTLFSIFKNIGAQTIQDPTDLYELVLYEHRITEAVLKISLCSTHERII